VLKLCPADKEKDKEGEKEKGYSLICGFPIKRTIEKIVIHNTERKRAIEWEQRNDCLSVSILISNSKARDR